MQQAFQNMTRFNSLLLLLLRYFKGMLQRFLCFYCKIVKIHSLLSFQCPTH